MTAFEQVANDIRAAHFVAYVRAAVGHEGCGGTGREPKYEPKMGGDSVSVGTIKCPAEHAVITVLGETIYADIEKCEWVEPIGKPSPFPTALMWNHRPVDSDGYYQPRWPLLSGGE